MYINMHIYIYRHTYIHIYIQTYTYIYIRTLPFSTTKCERATGRKEDTNRSAESHLARSCMLGTVADMHTTCGWGF